MRGYALDCLLVKPVNYVAIEFLVSILVSVGILRRWEVQCRVACKLEKGMLNHFETECIDYLDRVLQVVAWPVFNAPASFQVSGSPHLESLVEFGGPLRTLQMIGGPLLHMCRRFLKKVRQKYG